MVGLTKLQIRRRTNAMEPMKYHDNRSYATNPLSLTLSLEKLRDLSPEMTGFRGLLSRLAWWLSGKPHLVEVLKEHIRRGDSQPAVVVETQPFLVAAYSEDLDCVAILRFPDRFVGEYGLQARSKLISVNTYGRAKRYQRDLIPGPNRDDSWTGFHPVIADFVSDDEGVIEHRKNGIGRELWTHVYGLGIDYIRTYPGVWRDGRPFHSKKPIYSITEDIHYEPLR
jgi:hypothetical protein